MNNCLNPQPFRCRGAVFVMLLLASMLARAASPPSLQVLPGYSVLQAEPQGDAATASRLENRQLSHSGHQPLGRFVRKGQVLTVKVDGESSISIAIGLFGSHAGLNDGKALDRHDLTPVAAGSTAQVTAALDGMVYVVHRGTIPVQVTVHGGQPTPTLILGATSKAEFDAQMNRYPDAPFALLAGKRIFGEFHYALIKRHLALVTPQRIASWDRVLELTNEVYGLVDNASGVARKAPHRVYIANPDSGPGYASAGQHRITFQDATGAGSALFTSPVSGQWGLWHEIGHTYQTRQYQWENTGEVLVNISSLAVQERLGFGNRLDSGALRRQLADFQRQPVSMRRYADIKDLFLRVLMFDQLRRAFGEHFYPRLSQVYRLRALDNLPDAGDDASRQQLFALLSSQVADRNLAPFFEQWGITLDASTRQALAAFPPLRARIWTSHDRATDPVERAVPPYVLPTAALRPMTLPARAFGDTALPMLGNALSDFSNTDGMGTARWTASHIRFQSPGPAGGVLALSLQSDRGLRDDIVLPFNARPGNSLELLGISDGLISVIALDPATSTFHVTSSGRQAHLEQYIPGRYIRATLFDTSGRQLLSHTINSSDTAAGLVTAMHGASFTNGYRLQVEHAEPASRLRHYLDDVRQPPATARSQTFVVRGNRLLRETSAPARIPAQKP